MSKVYCVASTCKYFKKGVCSKEYINLEDFEYYKSADDKEKQYLEDDIRCTSYISKYGGSGVNRD